MHIHFLGICGTFMGSLALLARELGHEVSGCDANVYPPMSTQLEANGIKIYEGYSSQQFLTRPDMTIIGNVMSRGNEAVEYVLNHKLPYRSGPQWLSEHVLENKWVLAVAGTHGKTTTSSMLAWILEHAGMKPGFLIGGVPQNFTGSARLGDSDFFVIEADEYDTAFFDKRSKFVHYHPQTLVLNNLEYDHADIFSDIEAIKVQFHHLMRILPSTGLAIYPDNEEHLQDVIDRGCWSEKAVLGNASAGQNKSDRGVDANWSMEKVNSDGSRFRITNLDSNIACEISWGLIGDHNVQNAYAACVAAMHAGVPLQQSAEALGLFKGVKRRFELLADIEISSEKRVKLYDDFAHHPSAIRSTLSGLRQNVANDRIIAVIEPKSNTMQMGIHGDELISACESADEVFWFVDPASPLQKSGVFEKSAATVFDKTQSLISHLDKIVKQQVKGTTHIVIMSNGGFNGIHQDIIEQVTASSKT